MLRESPASPCEIEKLTSKKKGQNLKGEFHVQYYQKKQVYCYILREKPMSELKFDQRNYRIHNDKNKRVIRKSLEDCGAGRSVLVDKDNVLIAGNGVYELAFELGLKVRFVKLNGEELLVVKRTVLSFEV